MIKQANDNKEEIKSLWRKCFHDPDIFVDFYFEKEYKDENTFILYDEDGIASFMQLLPYDIKYCNTILKSRYLSGLATVPEKRKKGYMRDLIRYTFEHMIQDKCAFAILIPENLPLFGFYERTGFTATFDTSYIDILKPSVQFGTSEIRKYTAADLDKVYSFYKNAFRGTDIAVLKSKKDLDCAIEDHTLGGGSIYYAEKKGKVCGTCFVIRSGDDFVIKEALASDKTIENDLIYAAMDEENADKAKMVQAFYKTGHRIPLGMTRILEVKTALSAFAREYPCKSFSVRVSDPDIQKNNGLFLVEKGKVTCLKQDTETTADFDVDIKLLTRLLFGYKITELDTKYHVFPQKDGYINLMLN